MATENPFFNKQGTLNAGDNILQTCPNNRVVSVGGITFSNPAAVTISLRINRANPVSSVIPYTFNLDAGDVMKDNTQYILFPGDSITVNSSIASTTYFFTGDTQYINPPPGT